MHILYITCAYKNLSCMRNVWNGNYNLWLWGRPLDSGPNSADKGQPGPLVATVHFPRQPWPKRCCHVYNEIPQSARASCTPSPRRRLTFPHIFICPMAENEIYFILLLLFVLFFHRLLFFLWKVVLLLNFLRIDSLERCQSPYRKTVIVK